MNKLYEPGEILAKEVERGGILVKGRNGMDTNCATAKGIVATGAATNRNGPNRASADREPTDGGSAYRKNNSDGRSPERKETDRESAKGKEAARQSSKGEPASSNVT
jgi:hypothetical protein